MSWFEQSPSSRASILRGQGATGTRVQILEISPYIPPIDTTAKEQAQNNFEKGYEEGFQIGFKTAEEIPRKEQQQQLQALKNTVASLEKSIDDLKKIQADTLTEITTSATTLAFELTKVLVGRELELSTSPGIDAIKRALQLAPKTGDLNIHLNPSDATACQTAATESFINIKIFPDEQIDSGSCIVDIGATTIDAQINTALERVRKVLLEDNSNAC